MAGERRINFGLDSSDAKYRVEDTDLNGGDLVLAEDLDGGTVLLRWDDTAGEWVYGGPVNMGGADISNVGSLSTEKETIKPQTAEAVAQEYSLSTEDYIRAWAMPHPESGYSGFYRFHQDIVFNGTTDPVSGWGWNRAGTGGDMRVDDSDASLGYVIEGRFDSSSAGQNITETYIESTDPAGNNHRHLIAGVYQSDGTFSTELGADGRPFRIKHGSARTGSTTTVWSVSDNGNRHPVHDFKFGKISWSDEDGNQLMNWLGSNGFLVNGFSWTQTENAVPIISGRDSGGSTHAIAEIDADDNLEIGDGTLPVDTQSGGEKMSPRGDPTTSELDDGEVMRFVSNGSGTGSAGDLVYARNNSGTIQTQVIVAASNAT
jgi:hypothetical protein